MRSLFSRFLLTPRDLGIDKLSVQEIAETMGAVEKVDDSLPYEFADAVRLLLEPDSSQVEGEKESLSGSTEQSKMTQRTPQFKPV